MINVLFGTGSVCLSLALLPAVVKRQPPPLLTCVLTALWLWVFDGCYVSQGWIFSTVAGAATASLWTVLCAQRVLSR